MVINCGSMKPCLACTLAKAKQKNVNKCNEQHVCATKENLRIFVDLAWFKNPVSGPKLTKRYWRLLGDERTQLKFTDFSETKNGMVKPTAVFLNSLSKDGHHVQYIRCENGGENKLLETTCNCSEWKMNLKFEFTARDTPQQNWLFEKGLATILSKARALMADANIPNAIRYLLYREAITTATLLDGLVAETIDGQTKTRYAHFYGENQKWVQHLKTWGEAGTVKIATDTTSKLEKIGVQCMFVGYAKDHAGDVYRMWDPTTNRVHVTRDVIWLKRMCW